MTQMEILKIKALTLPTKPGVYLMKDKHGVVIYVGKAKKLKNRVTQYFQDTGSHNLKTRQMVSKVADFDVIIAASEFEALVLECSLIKQHMPKYNILLKDGKGYPYLRLDMNDIYPAVTMVNKPEADHAEYYGPFGSRGVTNDLLNAIKMALKLPNCTKKFPRDIGKDRPCLHYHLNQCAGWCQNNHSQTEYRELIEQVQQLLLGNYKKISNDIKQQMLQASDDLNFELAAALRDRHSAIEALGRRQIVTAGREIDVDAVGYSQTETKACFSVLHFSAGNLIDKDYEILPAQDDVESAVSSLIKQYYLSRGFAPKLVLLPFETEDRELFEQMLLNQYGKRTKLLIPQRGTNVKLLEMARANAHEEAARVTQQAERISGTLQRLGRMLSIDPPKRIEAYDISNISGTDIVAGMVVFCDGKPRRSEYRRFKIDGLTEQNDYASMRQVITRRMVHLKNKDRGFDIAPDILLIDGGINHARTAMEVLEELNLRIPVFGMVKDDRHRTRALVTPGGEEIRIDNQQSIFSFVGNIQEETHNYAIGYHRSLRSKRLRYSVLDNIPGIGPKRKEDLLKHFRSLEAIRNASLIDLERYLPKSTALAVYSRFHPELGEVD